MSNDYGLTERGEFLAENSYVLHKARGYLSKLSVSDDQMDYGIDREQKENLLADLLKYLDMVAECAVGEIPVDGGKE